MAKTKVPQLTTLARLYGVQSAYYDVEKRRRAASPEVLLLVLRSLGAPVEHFADVPAAVRSRRLEVWKRCIEPGGVAWDGGPLAADLRLPAQWAESDLSLLLDLEGGDAQRVNVDLRRIEPQEVAEIEGETYVTKRLVLPGKLPYGYHRLTTEVGGRLWESMIISTPRKAFADEITGKTWGGFLPLYALNTRTSWGAGDFSDLEAFLERVAREGGGVVGTLPLLASYLDEPFDPSPYSPASRLFWNEFYIDVGRVPELKTCPKAQSILESEEFQREVEALRSAPLVEYRQHMALKRRVLEELARSFFSSDSERRAAFEAFKEDRPWAEDYARFRAVGERLRAPWPTWPERIKNRSIHPEDYDEETKGYYLYTQWVANEQILSLAEKAREFGPGLYLDFPLGVHPNGFDTWRERDTFAPGTSVGAPPDAFFTKGQNWGFPPLCPQKLRTQHYRYIIKCLTHHLRAAGILRVDHIMALHRLFWIPSGCEAAEGVYVRYNSEELYAILSLESHRHQSWIVGENLGTVPFYVNPTMSRHKIFGMYVLQYELSSDRPIPIRSVGPDCVASLNTHDMPTFASFWQGLDVDDRKKMGLLTEEGVRREMKNREEVKGALIRYLRGKGYLNGPVTMESALRACLAHLSASPARVVLVNVEDLWLETNPQNVPGTYKERPNWRRKATYRLETFSELPGVHKTLQEVNHRRTRGGGV